MTLLTIRSSGPYAAVMAALHQRVFAKAWSRAEFASLSGLPGVSGWIVVDNAPPGLDAPLPVGFVLTRLAADEAEILTLAVIPPYRRRGVARSLIEGAATKLFKAGGRMLFLEVATGNEGALALYEKLGFSEVGRRPNYYDPGTATSRDALTLRAPLPLPNQRRDVVVGDAMA